MSVTTLRRTVSRVERAGRGANLDENIVISTGDFKVYIAQSASVISTASGTETGQSWSDGSFAVAITVLVNMVRYWIV